MSLYAAGQGEFVLEINNPAVSADAHDHPPRRPRRKDAARAATPIASRASPVAAPTGSTAAKFGSKR